MSTEIGWTTEDDQHRKERIRAEIEKTAERAIKVLRQDNLLRAILAWDEKRGYIMPYRLRDPIRKELGE